MYVVMGSSQAMKSAWIEDVLSFLPPALFLVTAKIERWSPTDRFPYGFHRVGSLAFFAAACALLALGAILLFEAIMTLIRQEHPTIGTVSLMGREVWLGWPMMAALLYSVVPPIILGRMKKKPAQKLTDKILHTDADMNAADWQTGLAGIAGIVGIGLGLWWADAAAAALISGSILKDGYTNVKIALAELIDGAPRALGSDELHDDVARVEAAIVAAAPDASVRLRESGRYLRGVVDKAPTDIDLTAIAREAVKDRWRVIEIAAVRDGRRG